MHELTEKTLDSEQLLDGHLLKVYRDRVQLPDGTTSVREWIRHPGAAAVVPLFDDGTTLLVRQFRYPPRRTFLEVPAGKLDKGSEHPEAVAARELEEETGWKAGRFTQLGAFYPCIGYSNEIIYFYLAEDLEEGERGLEDGEHMEVVPMSLEKAIELVRLGEVLDMKSVTALLFAQAHLERRQADAGMDA